MVYRVSNLMNDGATALCLFSTGHCQYVKTSLVCYKTITKSSNQDMKSQPFIVAGPSIVRVQTGNPAASQGE